MKNKENLSSLAPKHYEINKDESKISFKVIRTIVFLWRKLIGFRPYLFFYVLQPFSFWDKDSQTLKLFQF